VNCEPQLAVSVEQVDCGKTGTSQKFAPADDAVKTHILESWVTAADSGGYFLMGRPRMMSLTAQAFVGWQAEWNRMVSEQPKATEKANGIVLSA